MDLTAMPRLRKGRASETDAVLALWREADASPSVTDTPEDVQRILDGRCAACLLVAELDDRIVGTVIGAFDGWRGSLYRLAVHPAYRRRGIARALVRAIEEHLVHQGAKRIAAMVEKERAWAMAFWTAAGYEHNHRVARFVHNVHT